VVREYEAQTDCSLSLWFERSRQPAWGLFGGEDAAGPEVVINPGRQDERRMLKVNGTNLKKGDVVRCATGGGGGYGDPVERATADVRTDVLDRNITPDTARHRYGIGAAD
jgi:N-methylhydantoinase B